MISSAEFPLEFRTSKTQTQKICSFGSTRRIYFSPTDIEIRVNKEVVYTKPIERLLGSIEGAEWLSQLILEKQAFRGTPHEDEHAEAEPHSGLGLISYERHGGTYKNGELKRKLLQGANFHCAQLKSRGAHTENRVFFRGVQLTVPLKANTQTVCVRVDLVPEGTVHPLNVSTVARQAIQHIVLASKSDTEPCMKMHRRNSSTELQRKATSRSSTP